MSTNKGTWAAWVEQYYTLLLSRVHALFQNSPERSIDFLHELLLELQRKWEEIENPLAWISCTMRYRIADYWKKASESLPEDLTDTKNDTPELQEEIKEAMDRLPGSLKNVLTLFLEGNSIVEIAQMTNLSDDAIYQRLSRARKELKKNLGGNE